MDECTPLNSVSTDSKRKESHTNAEVKIDMSADGQKTKRQCSNQDLDLSVIKTEEDDFEPRENHGLDQCKDNCQPLFYCDMCPNTVSLPESCNVDSVLIRCDACQEVVKLAEEITITGSDIDEGRNSAKVGGKRRKLNTDEKVVGRNKRTQTQKKKQVYKTIKLDNPFDTDEETKFNCSLCEKVFKSASVLRRHMSSHAEAEVPCQATTFTKGNIRSSLNKPNLNCADKTDTVVSDPTSQCVPVKTEPNDDRGEGHSCNLCGKTFRRANLLYRHTSVCQSQANQCSMCRETFPSSGDLKSHMKIHFKCSVCEKSFQQSSDLKRHRLTHTGEKRFKCETCDRGFTSNTTLKSHTKMHRDGRVYRCNMCKENFTGLSAWKLHIRNHKGEKIYQCQECNKSYRRATHLKRHTRLHTGEKPFSCDFCGDTFNCSQYLQRHRRIHTGEKPYPCNVCGTSFRDQSCLRRHKRVHSGEKPYSCKQCPKAFSSSANLKRHMRSHTGEKPYQCNICNKSYKQRVVLQAHMMSHTGEKPHQCPACGKAFIQQSNMKTHYQHHHGAGKSQNKTSKLTAQHTGNENSENQSEVSSDTVTIAVIRKDGDNEVVTFDDNLVSLVVAEGEEMKVVVNAGHELIVSHTSTADYTPVTTDMVANSTMLC